jgi:DNA-binding SARP family transcriptional activator
MQSPFIDFNLGLMEACAQMQRGDRAAAERCAREAFALSGAHGFGNTLAWIPAVMADLCALCLETGIEPEHVGQLVRARRLPAPANAPDNWTWLVRVHTLGGFRLLIEGKPLSFSGRPQHRTLELLKLIIAFGGRDVSVARVCSVLWPDSEGDAASRSFSVALHRLRKLLGEGTVELLDGNLSLNDRLCHVDALAFEQYTDAVAGLAEEADLAACGARLLALYQGHFLEGDDAPWALPRRQTLRSRFQHAMQLLGARLEQDADWEGAATLYRHALEKDPLSELCYRQLMACRSRQGRNAEAMETYRRCREMLSIVLGIAPSVETQALFRTIQAAGATGEVRQP